MRTSRSQKMARRLLSIRPSPLWVPVSDRSPNPFSSSSRSSSVSKFCQVTLRSLCTMLKANAHSVRLPPLQRLRITPARPHITLLYSRRHHRLGQRRCPQTLQLNCLPQCHKARRYCRAGTSSGSPSRCPWSTKFVSGLLHSNVYRAFSKRLGV